MTGVFYVPLRQQESGTDTELESAHKVSSGEENSPAAPAGIQNHNLSIMSLVLYQQAIYKCSNVMFVLFYVICVSDDFVVVG